MTKPMPYHRQGSSHEYETPQALFDGLDAEFGFTLDVCATAANAKCTQFLTVEDDALAQTWSGVCWMNPPYGREIRKWMRKAYEESQRGCTVVCLVPARTDAGWWHDYAMRGEVRLLRGRLRFSASTVNAPFPSAVVVFRGYTVNMRGSVEASWVYDLGGVWVLGGQWVADAAEEDGKFIAAARQDIPALLGHIDALTTRLAKAKHLLNRVTVTSWYLNNGQNDVVCIPQDIAARARSFLRETEGANDA